ncbi:hypothetical protein BDFB_000162 [Asbolus verrucosus]|uniref:Transmembrane protein n=1 Tax=Asbolus verrucosus TaxID=1661398 RepID=A0A482W8S8_ASBVE|nr:hypothetical protein BDFB_000162 [Asbolus verrucosus]
MSEVSWEKPIRSTSVAQSSSIPYKMKLIILFALCCFVFVVHAATVPISRNELNSQLVPVHRQKRAPLILTAIGAGLVGAGILGAGIVKAGVVGLGVAGLAGAGLVGAGLGAKAGLAAG